MLRRAGIVAASPLQQEPDPNRISSNYNDHLSMDEEHEIPYATKTIHASHALNPPRKHFSPISGRTILHSFLFMVIICVLISAFIYILFLPELLSSSMITVSSPHRHVFLHSWTAQEDKVREQEIQRENQNTAFLLLNRKVALFEQQLMQEKDISSNLRSQLVQMQKKQDEVLMHQNMDNPMEKNNNPVVDERKLQNVKKKMDLYIQKSQQLQEELQRRDKKSVLDKYGPEPYHVEFQLDFPPSSPVQNTPTSDRFIIEMAPLDYMPHTVHLFLEQVSNQLYDGTSFHRNAGHVVQGGPVPYYKNPGARLAKRYRDLNLESVAFQEYHPKFPHVKYTLGFAGRPGGPDFYVSTINNTYNHGPGGQSSYDIPEEADPCFAKVIEGFEAVDRMAKMPVRNGDYRAMKDNVGIISARMIQRKNNA